MILVPHELKINRIQHMSMVKTYESVGSIQKNEKLATYYPGYDIPYLVLEAMDTFPGYYSAMDQQITDRPLYLYLVVKSTLLFEEDNLIRATQSIKRKHQIVFDAVPGELMLFNKLYHCIRLDLKDVMQLRLVLDCFTEQGIAFVKHRDVKVFSSMVRLKRYFEVEELAEGIWKDKCLEGSYYLIVSQTLKHERFEKISMHVRNNMELAGFDIASGYWYNRFGLVDFVRIYHRNIKPDDLLMIRDKYNKAIEAMQ